MYRIAIFAIVTIIFVLLRSLIAFLTTTDRSLLEQLMTSLWQINRLLRTIVVLLTQWAFKRSESNSISTDRKRYNINERNNYFLSAHLIGPQCESGKMR